LRIRHPEIAKEFFQESPKEGLGIATGDESGIMAVHVYGPKGKRHAASLNLPPTWQAKAADSVFYYYCQPNHLLMPAGFLPGWSNALPGIDIVATRGFAIVPPTTHPSGKRYSWITPDDCPLADCPLQIIQLLERRYCL
jgi:hypothetical protein